MMKRLRAPEHQTAAPAAGAAAVPGAPNPADGAQENAQTTSEASTAPSSTAESNSMSTEAPAAEAPSDEIVAAAVQPPAEPVLHAPAPEQPDPTSRCNGEALAPLPSDTGEEQSG